MSRSWLKNQKYVRINPPPPIPLWYIPITCQPDSIATSSSHTNNAHAQGSSIQSIRRISLFITWATSLRYDFSSILCITRNLHHAAKGPIQYHYTLCSRSPRLHAYRAVGPGKLRHSNKPVMRSKCNARFAHRCVLNLTKRISMYHLICISFLGTLA